MICGIYKLTSPENKVYIGKSTNIIKRWNMYKKLNCKKQPKLYQALLKYGPDNFKYEILKICDKENLNENEIFFIRKYNAMVLGYNATIGGDGILMTQEIKNKISKTLKSLNLKRTKNHIQKIKDSCVNNKEFLNQQSKGKIVSNETRLKISEKLKINNGMKNKVFTKKELENRKNIMRKQAEKHYYKFISPSGEVFITNRFRDFIEQHNLSLRLVRKVISKERPHHKNWIISKI